MDEHYEGREQSAAKHLILRRYLEKLAFKVGFTLANVTINYIDAFAGPWESKSADLDDISPSIALRKLLEVKQTLAEKGRAIGVRAFFVSPSARGVEQLVALRTTFPGAEITVVQSKFEDALDEARAFARGGSNPFAFIFIDPTGWTGFGLRDITPLLRQRPSEVLINFMTEHVRRFADDDDASYSQSIVDLFGDAECRDEWRGLEHIEREERIIEAYCRRVAAAGEFQHCVSSVVWKPTEDRSYFRLDLRDPKR
jgi:three-Cys-motif partner protein